MPGRNYRVRNMRGVDVVLRRKSHSEGKAEYLQSELDDQTVGRTTGSEMKRLDDGRPAAGPMVKYGKTIMK